jgi:hypothetical protein
MAEGWRLADEPDLVTGDQVADLIRRRVRDGVLETWLKHDTGIALSVVTNGDRAMVMLLDEPGDAGGHAVDPGADGEQSGYVLGNGQQDTYGNHDTLPLDEALRTARHIVEHGHPPEDADWHSDR